MQFANPMWLWGLTGILVPIGIHLLSRKQGSTVKIGSIRHLEDTHTKRFKSFQLNEVLLLVLRCALLLTLVLFLSGLQLEVAEKKRERWLLVEKGLEHDAEFSFLIDSLKQSKFEIKLLAPNFPDLKDSIENETRINYWNLVEDLKSKSLEHVVVLSYSYAVGFKGLRKSLPEYVQWISKASYPEAFALHAIRATTDTILLRVGQSDALETSFITRAVAGTSQSYFKFARLDSVSIENPDTISIAVVSDSTFAYDKNIMTAALTAIKETTSNNLSMNTYTIGDFPTNQKRDWVIWLSDKPISPITSNTIFYQESNAVFHTNLIQRRGNTRQGNSCWVLTKRLNEAVALEDNLTVQLASILLLNEIYDRRTQHHDKRVLPEKIMWSSNASLSTQSKSPPTNASGEKFIATLFLFIFLIERFVALKRNQ